jgi:DnaJ like chaperone protein
MIDGLGLSPSGWLRAVARRILGGADQRQLSTNGRTIAFTIAVVSLSAKLSKADGISLPIEVETFERLFHVPASEMGNVRAVFDRAKQDVTGFDAYARTIAAELSAEPSVKRAVFEGLFHIATADGLLHEGEDRLLVQIADIFGYAPVEYRAIRAQFIVDNDDPYAVLGLDHGADDQSLKTRYRQLARENHPDMMMGRGLPREAIEVAQRKLAAINAAYDAISRERGL